MVTAQNHDEIRRVEAAPQYKFVVIDTEFTELSPRAQLLSIALVDYNNPSNYIYREVKYLTPPPMSDWVRDNVYVHLGQSPNQPLPLDIVRIEVLNWLIRTHAESGCPQIRVLGNCLMYDWILFVDLLTGRQTARELPDFIDYRPLDADSVNFVVFGSIANLPAGRGYDPGSRSIPGRPHQALYDALCAVDHWEILAEEARRLAR